MTRRAIVALALLASCALTMGAGWLSGPRFGAGIGPGFSPVGRVGAQADTRVAWNADPDCVYFDGSDDVASAASIGLPATGTARTVMMWFKAVKNLAGGGGGYIFNYGAAQNFGWRNNYNDRSTFTTKIGMYQPGAPAAVSFLPFGYDQTVWKHIAFTTTYTVAGGSPNSSMTMYIDGIVNPINSYEWYPGHQINTAINGTSLVIGDGKTPIRIAEFAIFNRTLSQTEIQSIMNYKIQSSEAGLVRLYHFDEGSGSTAYDTCGSGYDLTLLQGATWTTKL